MINRIIVFCLLLLPVAAIAQQFSGKINNTPPNEMDVVVFPFGTDLPVKIGTVEKNGQVHINLDTVVLPRVSKDTRETFFVRLNDNFFVKCDAPDSLATGPEREAINCGMPFLWQNNQVAGALFLVSDEKLKPWIEDRYYQEPVKASFFEIMYVEADVSIAHTCNTTFNLESGNVNAINKFNLKLKKGFNLVQYVIEYIHTSNQAETASIPNSIQIINPQANTTILWVAKYF